MSESEQQVLEVATSRRSLISSRAAVGWIAAGPAILLLGIVIGMNREDWFGRLLPIVVAVLVAGAFWLHARQLVRERLSPKFRLDGTLLYGAQGQMVDLSDMAGIQTWLVNQGGDEPPTMYFGLIPQGETARVQPKSGPIRGYLRGDSTAPKELEPYTCSYEAHLRPRLHVFTTELQRRAPHLFIDHVGEV